MIGLLIGRFQPFHLGHLHAVRFALSRAEKVWLGIGSSNRPMETSNPFTVDERREMIASSLPPEAASKTGIYYIPDLHDHERWARSIDGIVPGYDAVFSNDEMTKHAFSKLRARVIPIPFSSREEFSGTNVRERIAGNHAWEHLVPRGTRDLLKKIGAESRLARL